jgi:arginine exporter protein ArgO
MLRSQVVLLACDCCGVAALSSFFDVPAGLLFVLSLAVSGPDGSTAEIRKAVLPENAAMRQETADGCAFSHQAWLRSLKQGFGGALFAGWPERIFKTSAGRYYVPVASEKRKLSKLRHDGAMSCFVALSAAMQNAHVLQQALSREPKLTDLYLAHAFGPDRAVALLQAARTSPNGLLADHFPNLDLVMPHVGALYLRKTTNSGFVTKLRAATAHLDLPSRGTSSKRFSSAARERTVQVTSTMEGEAVRPTMAAFNPRFQLTRMPLQALGLSRGNYSGMAHTGETVGSDASAAWSTQIYRD